MKNIRILVVDDHAVVRMGLISLLETESDITVVGEASDGEEAVAKARKLRPDLVLLDVVMPSKDGIAATSDIKSELPDVKILILTTFSSTDDIARAVRAGADGVLLKSSDYAEVVTAIRRVASGKKFMTQEVKKMLEESPPLPELTERQLDVIASMARGLTNADIAKQVGITADGVKFHIPSILAKLGAANRSEAIAIAIRNRLIRF